jgi:hypothetical protein
MMLPVPAELPMMEAVMTEVVMTEVVIVVIKEAEAEKRKYAEAEAVIIEVIASSPMAVPAPVAVEPAKSLAAMPAVHLLHQTVIELHCAEVLVGKAAGQGIGRCWLCRQGQAADCNGGNQVR